MKTQIEKLYQDYLSMVNLDELRMQPIQRQELRRAFYGGVSSLFKHLLIEIENDDLTEEYLDDIHSQCRTFWNRELARHQAKRN